MFLFWKEDSGSIPDDLTRQPFIRSIKRMMAFSHDAGMDVSQILEETKDSHGLFGIENQTDIEKNMPFSCHRI